MELVPVAEGQKLLGLRSKLGLVLALDEKPRDHHWDHSYRVATVLAVGARVLEVKVGDHVIFAGHAGKWVEPALGEGSLYRSVGEGEVLGVLETAGAVAAKGA